MESKGIGKYFVMIAIIIAFAVIVAAIISNQSITQIQRSTITTDGSYTQIVAPDKVEVVFTVLTKAKTAKEAQDMNSEISNKVILAFKEAGYNESDIGTVYYNVYPEYNWSEGTSTIIGYTATNQIKVKDYNVKNAGLIVDIAVSNGANQVNYIDFGLKPETEQNLKTNALAKASKNAREKADAIAAGMGTSVKKIISVGESNIYYPPYRMEYAMAAESAGETVKSLEIIPGNVEVRASVSVTFELK